MFFHILFWIAVWFFFAYFFSYNSEDKYFVMWFSTCLLPVTMALSYFMVYFLIPKYLLTKKYLPFALYTFYAFIFTSYALVLIIYGFLVFRLTFNISAMPPMSRNFLFIFILVLLVAGLISMQFVLNQTFKRLPVKGIAKQDTCNSIAIETTGVALPENAKSNPIFC